MFWKFNEGEQDRFRIFENQEAEKVKSFERRFHSGTAYNYHRFDHDLESAEWESFYRELTDQLFRNFDHIVVTSSGEIRGVRQKSFHILQKDPRAWSRAKELFH